MSTALPNNRRSSPRRLRPVSIVLLAAAVATVLLGALNMRLGPVRYYRLLPLVPRGIVVHHSATPAYVGGRRVDAKFLDEVHAARGWGIRYGDHTYHIGYHYVILPDGTVEPGRPEWMPGAHTSGYNHYLGICLVGNFAGERGHCAHPPPAQIDALVDLISAQMKKHDIPLNRLYRHRDLAATDCPGLGVPWQQIIHRVKARRAG